MKMFVQRAVVMLFVSCLCKYIHRSRNLQNEGMNKKNKKFSKAVRVRSINDYNLHHKFWLRCPEKKISQSSILATASTKVCNDNGK